MGKTMNRNACFAKSLNTLASIMSLTLLPIACGGGGSTTATAGDDEIDLHSDLVFCQYIDGLQYAVLCWEELQCGATPAQVCSMFFSNDLAHAHLWKDSYINNGNSGGYCNDGPEQEDTSGLGVDIDEVPPCVCKWGGLGQEISNSGDYRCTYDWPPTYLDDEEDWPPGYPIPSESTGTGDPTGGPTESIYVCDDTARTKCVEIWDVSPSEELERYCWIDPGELPAALVPCEPAADAATATQPCEDRCNALQTAMQAVVASHNNFFMSDQWILKDGDGNTLDSGEPDCSLSPRLMTASDVCSFNKEYLPTWEGSTALTPMNGTVSLTVTGGSAGNTGVVGFIGYQVTNCNNGICDVTFDALEGYVPSVSGIFTDPTGAQMSYQIEGMRFQLAQIVHGTLIQSRGTITFPNEPFVGIIRASDHSIAGVPLGPLSATQPAHLAAGNLSSSHLTLNLAVELPDGVFTITFQTG